MRVAACHTRAAQVGQEFLEPFLPDRRQEFFPPSEVVVGRLMRHTDSTGQVAHREVEVSAGDQLQTCPDASRAEIAMVVARRRGRGCQPIHRIGSRRFPAV